MDSEDLNDAPRDEGSAKRKYTPPTLVTYGDAVQLTQSGNGGRKDGGRGGGRNRTS